jgi:hypothetical protein
MLNNCTLGFEFWCIDDARLPVYVEALLDHCSLGFEEGLYTTPVEGYAPSLCSILVPLSIFPWPRTTGHVSRVPNDSLGDYARG